MQKHEDYGPQRFTPSLAEALDQNARSLADELTTPHRRLPEILHTRGKKMATRPGYPAEDAPTQASGMRVSNASRSSNAALAPLTGRRFRQWQQEMPPGLSWLAPLPEREPGQ